MATSTTHTRKKKSFLRRHGLTLLFVVAFFAGLAFAFIRAELKISAMEDEMVQQKAEIEQQANQQIAERTDELLTFAVKGYDWAIRGELIRGNEENAQRYLAHMVQDEKVSQVQFIDADQIITMASDKNRETQLFDISAFPENPLDKEDIHLVEQTDGSMLIFSPILGLERRLGTLMVRYQPQPFSFLPTAGSPSGEQESEE